MTQPQQQKHAKGAKSGLKEGDNASPPQKGGKRPVEEEDVFGGVERAKKGGDVKSNGAKP